jgi:anaerobic ribonucleoside-triphosphate reductase activating protein
MDIRIAGVTDDSVVDGDGYRFTIFTQGCPHHCLRCQNPATWDLHGGKIADSQELLQQALANPLLTGLTFSGGEPFCQPQPLSEIAAAAHTHGLDIWCYSGWTLEQLQARHDEDTDRLLALIDVLVDGPYIDAQRDLTLHFRGSKNQRVIDMAGTRQQGHIILKYKD